MKYILPLTILLTLAFGALIARVERNNTGDSEAETMLVDVPGAIVNGNQASAKQGYMFAQESRKSISVIKTFKNSARLQTGTLVCVSPGNSACDAFLLMGRTGAMCKGGSQCHFEGIVGGVRAP